jgi:hypothetical protein
MQRLQRIAYHIIWVNPLKVTPGYAPLARGMAAALPYVDSFVEGHSMAAMEELAAVIATERRSLKNCSPTSTAGRQLVPAWPWLAWSTSRVLARESPALPWP